MFNKIYKFKEGRHYTKPFSFNFSFNKNSMSCCIMFPDDILGCTKKENMLDWNKLFGFSRGFHHDNSFRFAWREDGDNVYVSPYTYIDGIRYSSERIDKSLKLDTNRIYFFKIKLSSSQVFYSVIDERDSVLFENNRLIRNELPALGYDLKPYFGGETTPLKDFSICFNTKNT